ncbi:MAG: PBP1A family penicillin-binding protein [Bacilli bacterium]|nr:PBP1A family penicillin-binding protein [Bacilli bacterium]
MKFFKKCIKLFISIIFLGVFLISGLYLYAKMLPKLDLNKTGSYYLYDNNEELYFQGNGTSEWASLDSISKYVIDATIIIEDKGFYSHSGFDILRIGKAMLTNITSGSFKQGASTITQQYAKNLYLEFDKTWERKLHELWYTIQIESHYEKDDILEGYLNLINYGHGNYGIENASKFYFNKKASELTLAESAMLVGIPKSPSNYSPLVNLEVAKERQKYILNTMLKNELIKEDEYNEAINEELVFYGKKDKLNLNTIMYYQDAVIKELSEMNNVIETYMQSGGIKVYTTLDINAQTSLEESIKNNIQDNDTIQASGIMINPNTGGVIALVGGRDYNKSQYNRAISSKRQVGSIMKPFLYYNALENGFTASTSFLSQETSFTLGIDNVYSPRNYNNLYANKPISMASAISFSDNIYAVKTHLFLGSENLVDTAKRVGIETKLEPIASLPLGTVELSHLEITNAYATLASEGIKHEPYFIEKITDMEGNILYEHKDTSEVVLNKSLTYILNDLLKGTYDYNMIDYTYPTNISISSLLTHDYAIKSGSTDTDNWIIGFNPDVVTSIWIGYDDNKELGSNDFKYSKKIWANAIESYLKDKEVSWYTIPDNVVGVIVDPITGNLATNESTIKKILYYIKGSEPNYTQQVFDEYENNLNLELNKENDGAIE